MRGTREARGSCECVGLGDLVRGTRGARECVGLGDPVRGFWECVGLGELGGLVSVWD